MAITAKKSELNISGMTCAACSARIERKLNKIEGVECRVNLATERATLRLDGSGPDLPEVIAAIERLGYGASEVASQAERRAEQDRSIAANEKSWQRERQNFAIAALLTLPLVAPMVGILWGGHYEMPGLYQFILATPVQFWFGWRFYTGAYKSLRSGSANMDVLVALGTTMAWLYSTIALTTTLSAHLYFEASAAIITLVLLGKILEGRAKQKSGEAIRSLLELQPPQATVRRGEEWQTIDAAEMANGDLFLVRPGERVPADGEVVQGESTLDESMLTGESLPVVRSLGETISAGTINGEGSLHCRATGVGEKTLLAGIIRLVEEAQGSRVPIQKLVDRISAVFVPTVVALSLLTFLGWWLIGNDPLAGFMNAIAVLVIACPCALGLATPTAIMVGTGLGARHGILIRNGEALERSEKIRRLLLDKTGTLTLGKPVVRSVETIADSNYKGEELLAFARALESESEHPLARAVVDYANQQSVERLELSSFRATPGKGISGEVVRGTQRLQFRLGSPRMILDEAEALGAAANDGGGGNGREELRSRIATLQSEGHTVMLLADESEPLLLLALADPLRPTTPAAIEELHRLGIETILLTGDNRLTAERIAAEAGIDEVEAEVLPERKAARVAEERERLASDRGGGAVAMAGDGINDAPALAAADVSYAFASGSDVAMQTADVTLMRSDPLSLSDSIALSRATMRKIRQNLFFAFIYNTAGLPLAAAGLLSPLFAGAAMALSSVSVVTSSLLLKRWRAPSRQWQQSANTEKK